MTPKTSTMAYIVAIYLQYSLSKKIQHDLVLVMRVRGSLGCIVNFSLGTALYMRLSRNRNHTEEQIQ